MSKYFIFAFTLLLLSCSNNDDKDEYPVCIQTTIDNYLKNYPEPRQKPATISKYLYKNQEVYIFDPGSGFTDILFSVIDNNCVSICELGGIAGIQTCEDWDNAKFITIVWKDKR